MFPGFVIDRYYFNGINDPVEKVYLHGFSDAADLAYGCCIYVKGIAKSGNTTIKLVTSKSRVVPIKQKLTIPRKELLGNFILSKLMKTVIKALSKEIVINGFYCWTDSTIALGWIRATSQEFKTFVENRVVEIRKNTPPELWRYCKTDKNPADIITRNENTSNKNNLWLNGPSFLFDNVEQTNYSEEGDSPSFIYEENKTVLLNSIDTKPNIGRIIEIEKFSSLQKLYDVTAWVLRFVINLKSKHNRIFTSHVLVRERRKAELLWLRENQETMDKDDREQLEKCLDITSDNMKLLRTHDRIKNANLPYAKKSPIILNRKHKLAELIVVHYHKLVQHMGARQTLAEVRSRFWITRGRSFVRGVLARNACPCKRINPRHYKYPVESDLPKIRLRDDTPFSGVGVDYFGPLYCKNVYIEDELEQEMYKAYVALYTCATTRGIVLDLVQDASATNYVNSLTRFIARRGCPKQIISDNGSVFTAKETQSFASSRNILWDFNIAEAPWHGGFFERLVQTVKRCLKKTIGNACLSFTELQTVLSETELIVNSRPLIELEESDLEEILTPNHLLFGRKLDLQNAGLGVYYDNDIGLCKRAKYTQTVIEHFWNRWRKEYLVTLRQYRLASKPRGATIKQNDIVLVFEEKQPRSSWRLGRVIELIGKRGAKVFVGKTRTEITRPINKLFPVET